MKPDSYFHHIYTIIIQINHIYKSHPYILYVYCTHQQQLVSNPQPFNYKPSILTSKPLGPPILTLHLKTHISLIRKRFLYLCTWKCTHIFSRPQWVPTIFPTLFQTMVGHIVCSVERMPDDTPLLTNILFLCTQSL